MVRMIQRRLIIPRGDTGSFSIPYLKSISPGDVAVFTIFDIRTKTKIYQKLIAAEGDILNIAFTHGDTVNLKPGKYLWDIKFYTNPQIIDDELVNGDEVDSYYAGFSLPECEIRETGDTLLTSDDAPTSTISPESLNIINAAINEVLNNKRVAVEAAEIASSKADAAAESAKNASNSASAASQSAALAEIRVNEIENLSVEVDTGLEGTDASVTYTPFTGVLSFMIPRGNTGNGIASCVLNDDFTLTINYTNGDSTTTIPIRGDTPHLTIGEVTEGPQAIATITGTDANPILNLTLPNANVPTKLSQLIDNIGFAKSADLAAVATSGSYTDLEDKPYIPVKTSDLTNDSNYAVDGNYVHTDNNYTTAEKEKLSGIAAGAEVNVNADWNANSGDAQILNKPTKVSDFTNDAGYLTEHQDISGKADKSEIPTKVSQLQNDSGYLTSYTETDPTVPAWAKAAQKPSYTAAEVGAPTIAEMNTAIGEAVGQINSFDIAVVQVLPTQDISTHTIYLVPKTGETNDVYDEYVYINDNWEMVGNTQINLSDYALKSELPTKVSELSNDSGYLTSYTETDPTVPQWAKANTKPSYTAAEVGALPSNTHIPTTTAELTNDAGFITSAVVPTKISDLTDDSGHYIKPETGIPASDLEEEIVSTIDGKAPAIWEDVNGSIVHFEDGAENMSLRKCVVGIEPVQDLHGYDSPWPGGGGVNLLPADYTERITLSKTFLFDTPLPAGQYTFSFISADTSSQVASYQLGRYRDKTGSYQYMAISPTQGFATFTNTEPCSKVILYSNKAYNESNGFTTVFTGLMVKAGGTGTYSPYSNICPITGWTGAKVYHSGEDTSNPTELDVTFPSEAGTVYGGTLDVTNGVLTVDRAYADLGTLTDWSGKSTLSTGVMRATLPRSVLQNSQVATTAIMDRRAAKAWGPLSKNDIDKFGVSPNGEVVIPMGTEVLSVTDFLNEYGDAQIVYPLATPITYQLTPQEIRTLLGTNNIWADTGDTSVTYPADTKMFVEQNAPESSVQDVQVNGASIVQEGVANVPVASPNDLGVIKVLRDTWGLFVHSTQNYIGISKATDAEAKGGAHSYKPIVPNNQHISTFYGLAKAAGADMKDIVNTTVGTYPDVQKEAIQSMLGITQMLAPENPNLVASQPYAIGDVFAANGHLYKATAAIAQDEAIIPDTNCVETTMVDAGGKIKDVQVNSVSVVGSDGVANIPVAGNGQNGVIQVSGNQGLLLSTSTQGLLMIKAASSGSVKTGQDMYTPIVPAHQHESAFYGLAKAAGADEKDSTLPVGQYTNTAKAAIKNMLGITHTLTVTVLTQDGVTVTGQTVYVRADNASGEIYATATYEGQPVSFSVPDGFSYHVSVSDTLDRHFNPTTASGIVTNTDIAVTLQYSNFSIIRTAADIKAALNAGMDLTDLVGEQITCSKGDDTLTWDVVDYDETNKNVTLLLHDVFGTANMVFEPVQALMWCKNGLAAGSYTFTWKNTQCYFTLATAIPAGGQLRATNSQFQTYASQDVTVALETGIVGTDEIAGAIDLGREGEGLLNHSDRVIYGSNNFAESALLWWLNSDAAANTPRVPVTKFSRAYSYAQPGFMNGLDANFVNCLDEVDWLCSTNNVYECPESLGGYTKGTKQAYTVKVKFGLASEMEIFGSYGGNADGSKAFDLYSDATAEERKKYRGTSAQVQWLRSPLWYSSYYERNVTSSGDAYSNSAYVSCGVVPVCRISHTAE